jgi:hypothetical protein
MTKSFPLFTVALSRKTTAVMVAAGSFGWVPPMIRTDPPGTPLSCMKTGVSTGVPTMLGNHSESMCPSNPGAGTTISGFLISRKFLPVKAASKRAHARRKAAVVLFPLMDITSPTPYLIIRIRRTRGIITIVAVTCFQKSFSLNMHLSTKKRIKRAIAL